MTPALLLAVERVTGPVRFPAAPPAWLAAVLLAGAALLVRWVYRRERQRVSRPWRVVLGGLRTLALVLVALILARPEREEATVAEERSHLVVLVDTSSSMSTVDRHRPEDEARLLAAAYPEGGGEARPASLGLSRGQIVQRTLAGTGSRLLASLAERFVLHVYAFDEDVRLVGSTEGRDAEGGGPEDAARRVPSDPASIGAAVRALAFEGRQTAVGAALKAVAREFVGRDDRRIAGVVVVTDGRDNAVGARPADALSGLGKGAEDLRVQAVALGDPRLARNLWVDRVLARDVVLVYDVPTFAAELRHKGFDDAEVDVSLEITRVDDERPSPGAPARPSEAVDERGRARVRLAPGVAPTTASLRHQFRRAGDYDVAVVARLPPRLAAEDAVVEDDRRVHRLRVMDSTIKVLLVDREMRYETHFLKNFLVRKVREDDPRTRTIDAHVWIQSFDPDVRKPASPGLEPLRAFPSTRQEVFGYDVVIFGDVAWRRLGATEEKSREILRILRDFVAEGGGIAFVAGETHDPTGYLETPLQDLVPVVVRPQDRTVELDKTVPFRVAPTDLGAEHPVLSLGLDGPQRVASIWREHDGWEWYWLYRARGGLKPGAYALARVANPPGSEFVDERGEPYVVFAGMGYGKGRVFFSAIDQVSRIRKSVADAYYGAFWDETIRWLATYRLFGGSRRYKIETDKASYFVGDDAVVKVSALDVDYQPLRDPVLRGFSVEGPDGKPVPVEAPRLDPESGPGVYRTSVPLRGSGAYRLAVDAPERDGARAEKRVEARFATREDQDRVPDHELLATLVRAGNPPGAAVRLWAPWQWDELARSIPARTTPRVLERRDVPLWDGPWPLVLLTVVLGLEWALRKRFQMI